MTREEAKALLLNISAYDIDTQRGLPKQEAIEMAIKALEQEPCDELDFVQPHKKVSVNLEVCKMREATQKEREGIDQYIDSIAEPCEDAISRQAVLEAIDAKAWEFCDYLISKNRNDEQKPVSHFADNLRECVSEELPPVTPQPKTGHWIVELKENVTEYIVGTGRQVFICSVCQEWQDKRSSYCPVCGSRMFEPQE